MVKTGLFLIYGGGANSLLRLNAVGSILVNGKTESAYRPMMSQIRRINRLSDLPLRAVIYTNHHDIHAGAHARFAAAGVGSIIQARGVPRLAAVPAAEAPAGAASAPPRRLGQTLPFERSQELNLGSVPVRLAHFGPAVTDNDTVVLFPDLKVLALGELVSRELRLPDYAGGGSLFGWASALGDALELDFETAIPSVGSALSKAEVRAFKAKLDAWISRGAALAKSGASGERLAGDLGLERLGPEEAERLSAELRQAR